MATAKTTEIVPTFDFAATEVELKGDPNLSLTDVLAKLATLPPTDPKNRPKPATAVELVTDGLMSAIQAIPKVFGQIKPRGRRQLTKAELVSLRDEKIEIDTAIKALTKRKDEIHKMVSVHFDVLADKQKRVTEQTRLDKNGHYLLASPGNAETAPVEGSGHYFTREKASDKAVLNLDKLLALYEAGEITRAELLGFTTTTRTIDETKIRRQLLNKNKRERTQAILDKITEIKPGNLSINLRGK
ncbi:hypothetical protein [Streptomyces sp. MH60]|uniref:hypothetical protein n=1 Tax=Streptomyces sp. MH60 TaxID=1940758 RepID=UPI000CEE9D80|nr:hypothetical protein [Streptomyces sp. MH60]PPS89502.1 hypothetical protein BZZ08_01648 [Streptomyces sp. MH60]